MRRTINLRNKWKNLKAYQESLKEGLALTRNLPLEIFAEVSNRCNINCIMCARPEDMGINTGEIQLEHIESLSRLFANSLMLHAYGFGEPFMNPHFFHLLKKAKDRFAYVDFFTNGMALTPERGKEVVAMGVDRVTVSVDGATTRTFETMRVGARLETVLENMRSLRAEKLKRATPLPTVDINFIATQENFHELPDMVGLASEMGVTHINVKPLITYAYKPELAALRRTYCPQLDDEFLDRTSALCAKEGIRLEAGPYRASGIQSVPSRELQQDPPSSPMCFQPWKTMYITWSGEVKTCCFAQGPVLGSLEKNTAEEIWFGDAYRALRDQIFHGNYPAECDHCRQFALMPVRDDAKDIFVLICEGMGHLRRSVVMLTR